MAVNGFIVEVAPVCKNHRLPVEVEFPSAISHALRVPVITPLVKRVLNVLMLSDKSDDGLVRDDHAVAAEPAQEPHVGGPPFVDTVQKVPTLLAAVAWITLVPLPYRIPLTVKGAPKAGVPEASAHVTLRGTVAVEVKDVSPIPRLLVARPIASIRGRPLADLTGADLPPGEAAEST